jgi:hypothetical protein
MKMEEQQIQDNEVVTKRGRLSTEMINLGLFSADKVSGDLEALEVAEKVNSNEETPTDSQEENTSQEMLALGLANPFRGY